MFRKVTPISHINLKTDRTNHKEQSWKTTPEGVTLLNAIDSSTEGFLEEENLSLTYGRPEKTCSSFTLMYFSGKRRTSRINLFQSH